MSWVHLIVKSLDSQWKKKNLFKETWDKRKNSFNGRKAWRQIALISSEFCARKALLAWLFQSAQRLECGAGITKSMKTLTVSKTSLRWRGRPSSVDFDVKSTWIKKEKCEILKKLKANERLETQKQKKGRKKLKILIKAKCARYLKTRTYQLQNFFGWFRLNISNTDKLVGHTTSLKRWTRPR